MAEQSVLLSGGDRIATIDSYENDASANARDTQYFIEAGKQHGFACASATRSSISSTDSSDLSSAPATTITVGDASTLVVVCQYQSSDATGNVVITPVIVDSSGSEVLGILEPKTFSGMTPSGASESLYRAETVGESTVYYSLCVIQTWPTKGAKEIGLHVTLTGNVTSVDVWFAAISGGYDDHLATAMPAGNVTWQAYASGE